jgi:hypothetical protein
MKAPSPRKKFCGTCRWYEETKPYTGVCSKYNIATRMESYRFSCADWAPPAPPPASGDER